MPAATPGYGVDADHRDAEAALAQDVGGAVAVDADQIGHHVARAAIPAVDEQRHCAAVRPGGGSARRRRRAGSRATGFRPWRQGEPVLLQAELRVRSVSPTSDGTVVARRRRSATRGRRGWRRASTRRRDPAQDRGRRRPWDRAGGFRRPSASGRDPSSVADGLVRRSVGEIGHRHFTRAHGDARGRNAESR